VARADVDNLLDLLNVGIDAFAMCEVGDGCALSVPGLDKVVVHYVLRGEGSIECEHGIFPIRPGSIAVIPRLLAKRINGTGAVNTVILADNSCPLVPGIIKFQACQANGKGLVLGCASVTAKVAEGLGLFDHLQQPIVETDSDPDLPALFEMILRELSHAGIGTKPMVETLMKQIFILLLRKHLTRVGMHSPLYLPLLNPQLGRAIAAMHARPQDPHCIDGLAALAGMSRSRFNHHFAATYGTTPMDYLHSVRLNSAARLLRTSQLPVKSVAMAVGFASRSHFSRAFSRQFGVDPSAFRNSSAEAGIVAPQINATMVSQVQIA
jgi:AraC-like DNA-binding protein